MPHFEYAKTVFISGQVAFAAVPRPCLLVAVIATNHDTAGITFSRVFDHTSAASNQVLELAHTNGQDSTVIFQPAVPIKMENGVYVTCSNAQNYVTIIYA